VARVHAPQDHAQQLLRLRVHGARHAAPHPLATTTAAAAAMHPAHHATQAAQRRPAQHRTAHAVVQPRAVAPHQPIPSLIAIAIAANSAACRARSAANTNATSPRCSRGRRDGEAPARQPAACRWNHAQPQHAQPQRVAPVTHGAACLRDRAT